VKPSAGGHTSLITDDATFDGQLDPTDLPDSAAVASGLRQRARECPNDGLRKEEGCQDYFAVEPGDLGYSANANIVFEPFGYGGFDGLTDNFVVEWTGEINILATGDYSFFIVSDDGAQLLIDDIQVLTKLNGQTADFDEIWGDHGALEASGEVTQLTAGWHRIKVKLYDQGGPSGILLKWITPYDPEKKVIPVTNLRRPLGNGSYACIGIERDPTQSSFISLNREIDTDNTFVPIATYLPDLPYYGSLTGSELKLFKQVVAADDSRTSGDEDPLYSRLYIEPIGNKSRQDIMSMALDLASSRKIIDNLVRSDVQNQSIINSAVIYRDPQKRRYFELSKAGRMLYQQLHNKQLYGQQTFVVRKGENIQLSGIVMKVDDQESLTSCPIGSAGAVSQFKSGCSKRFSKTVSFEELTQQTYSTYDFNSLMATTFTSDGNPQGCDIDLNVVISR
jgi:hypothetical protein